ncbi:MAG: NAD-dependent epimerase/dehydratase family protein [Bacteroidia bacterium]
MQVLVTGANGFIGNVLVKTLLEQGYQVKAMVRKSSDLRSLEGLDVELVYGDILEKESLKNPVAGCKWVFHVAGIFSYWGHKEEELTDKARSGMQNMMEVAAEAKVKRFILTSSSVTLGASNEKKVLSEMQPGLISEDIPYIQSKVEQEKRALELAGKYNLDLVIVNPCLTVGGPDYGLTESNRMIVNYLKDPMKSSWIGGCNIVSVEDVAKGHILAAEKGRGGERYLLGSENLEWKEVHTLLSELCSLPGPYMVAYHTSAFLASAVNELVSFFTRKAPASSIVQAKMVGQYYWYDHGKIAELGYQPQSAREALVKTISWLAGSEHISPALRAEIELSKEIQNYRHGF